MYSIYLSLSLPLLSFPLISFLSLSPTPFPSLLHQAKEAVRGDAKEQISTALIRAEEAAKKNVDERVTYMKAYPLEGEEADQPTVDPEEVCVCVCVCVMDSYIHDSIVVLSGGRGSEIRFVCCEPQGCHVTRVQPHCRRENQPTSRP